MKSKTLMTMAIAGAFGLSAASFAGSGHEVRTPYSPNEAGETFSHAKIFGSDSRSHSVGSTSVQAGGSVSGSSSSSVVSGDEQASLSMDDGIALGDQGIYSDFYVVTYQPATMGEWDYFALDDEGANLIALSEDTYWLMPTHELALIPSATDEMVYDLVLVPTTFDDMTAEFGSGMTESFGE